MLSVGTPADAGSKADMVDTIEAHHRVQMEKAARLKARLPQLQQQLADASDPEQTKRLKEEIAAAQEADVQYLLTVGPLLANYDPRNQSIKGQQFKQYIELTGDEGAKKRLQTREMHAASISRKHKKIKGRRNILPDIGDSVCECGGRKVTCHSEAACVCTACGLSSPYMDDTDAGLPYGQAPARAQSAYRRINHLQETLSQVQVR